MITGKVRSKEMLEAIKVINSLSKSLTKRIVLCSVNDVNEMLFLKECIKIVCTINPIQIRVIIKPVELVQDFILSTLQSSGSTIILALNSVDIPEEIKSLCDK